MARRINKNKAKKDDKIRLNVKVKKGIVEARTADDNGKIKKHEPAKNETKNVRNEEKIYREKTEPAAGWNEKTERDKNLLMWSGVSFFMILIFIVWVYNLKTIVRSSMPSDFNDDNSIMDEWEKISEEFGASINSMKENLDAVNTFSENAAADATSTLTGAGDSESSVSATSTAGEKEYDAEEQETLLKEKLIEIKNKAEAGE